MEQIRTEKPWGRLAIALTLSCAAVLVAILVPRHADAGVAGLQNAFGEFGTEPGQLSNPKALGVDNVDGSVFVGGNTLDSSTYRVQKFSSAGTFEGEVALPRTAETTGAEGRRSFIGIAVDHQRGVFYLLQDEAGAGVRSAEPETRVATKILAFKTTPETVGSEKLLVPAATPSLPVPSTEGAQALIKPEQLVLDPSDGDLVVAAQNPSGHTILQRIGANGTAGALYTESGTNLVPTPAGEEGARFGIAVGKTGTTYLIGANATAAFELSPSFTTLSAIPGFTAARGAEEWAGEDANFSAPTETGVGYGPQAAVSYSASGEPTLYWKVNEGNRSGIAEIIGSIHGFSLAQQRTAASYGGSKCTIQTGTAALAGGPEDSVLLLDQGEEVEEASNLPSFGPRVVRFGPAGAGCLDPAPAVTVGTGCAELSSAPVDSTLLLDASGSELGLSNSAPFEVKKVIWTIEGPGASKQQIPVSGPAPSLQLRHEFTQTGDYEVSATLEVTQEIGRNGHSITSKPKAVSITSSGGGGSGAAVTNICPNHGPAAGGTSVIVVGTGLGSASQVTFGSVPATNVTQVSGGELKVTSPAGTAGTTVDVTVTTPGGTSAASTADRFSYDALPNHTLTVTKAGTGSGDVTCNGAACATSYPAGTVISLLATPSSGSSFVGWGGGGCSGTGSCSVTINADTSISATFNTSKSGGGSGGGGSGGTTTQPGTGGSGSTGGGGTTKPPLTKAQRLQAQRQKALAKCKKLKGKAKAQCVKKANQIGKPKKKNHHPKKNK
ncbi:MAG: IPT/TIG domain-containing protein [Solirubrobacterales bacterium]